MVDSTNATVELTQDELNKVLACLALYEAHVAMTPEKKAAHDAFWNKLDDVAVETWGYSY